MIAVFFDATLSKIDRTRLFAVPCNLNAHLIVLNMKHLIIFRRVLLAIRGGGVPPSSPNPDPISDQKMSFFTPVYRLGL